MFFHRSNGAAWKNPWKGWHRRWSWRRLLCYYVLPSLCSMPTCKSRWSWRISTKSFSNLPHNYHKSAYRHFYITDNYRFVMNAKNHSLISCIIKVILIFSYSYYKYLNIFLCHLFLLTDMTGCKNIINNKSLP